MKLEPNMKLSDYPYAELYSKSGDCSRSRAAAGSLLRDTQTEIQQLESTGDPIYRQAANELREAANYSFPANK